VAKSSPISRGIVLVLACWRRSAGTVMPLRCAAGTPGLVGERLKLAGDICGRRPARSGQKFPPRCDVPDVVKPRRSGCVSAWLLARVRRLPATPPRAICRAGTR
jgi:hypothetical protein